MVVYAIVHRVLLLLVQLCVYFGRLRDECLKYLEYLFTWKVRYLSDRQAFALSTMQLKKAPKHICLSICDSSFYCTDTLEAIARLMCYSIQVGATYLTIFVPDGHIKPADLQQVFDDQSLEYFGKRDMKVQFMSSSSSLLANCNESGTLVRFLSQVDGADNIIATVKELCHAVSRQELTVTQITSTLFEQRLTCRGCWPEVDMVYHTSNDALHMYNIPPYILRSAEIIHAGSLRDSSLWTFYRSLQRYAGTQQRWGI
eukprot:GILJ01003904.1.p1 GENE.GILJ01003904.1~~GILJ01003904.1.p1  ORF type:complete len:270 (+),score=22.23 GILJ01003904.1:41-811(+)